MNTLEEIEQALATRFSPLAFLYSFPFDKMYMLCPHLSIAAISSPRSFVVEIANHHFNTIIMGPAIGIDLKKLAAVAQILSVTLADEFLLYTKTRNAHWNVEGPDFYAKHTFFEKQYEQLDETMDDVAERIRELGHYAPATLKQYLLLTRLTEASRSKNDSHGFVKELLVDHESIIIYLRENINHIANDLGDIGTSDFMTGLLETHEKMAWMLRAHLPE